MNRRHFLLFIVCFFLVGNVFGETHLSERPNILLILTDDQGYGDVGAYGARDLQTPYMDSLIDDGMRFDEFYANSPVCSPTRAALLSGRYQELVGVPGVIRTHSSDNWGYLSPEAVLLPSLLRGEGYHTALIGKWHLGLESPNTPNDRGFDYFHGWLGDMVEDFWEHRRHGINYMRRNEEEIDPEGHVEDLLAKWAVDYVKERSQDDRPFFLFLSHLAPHFPVQPPEEWLEKVMQRETDISERRAKLVAFIEHLDDGIGQVIQALKETGQYENTIIVFTSDNGGRLADEADNGPLRDGKQSVYEGGIKVPAAVVWPGYVEPGSRSDRLALTMDVFPTLLDAVGIEYDDSEIDGISFLPTLLGEDQPERSEPVFFTRREGWERFGGLTIQAVRLGDWKLLQNSPFGPQELYNLREDPLEENNLIDERRDKYIELNSLMMEHIQRGGAVPWQE